MSDSNKLWTDVDQYFAELFVGTDATLSEALAASSAAGLPDIAVAPNQGKLLHLLVRMNRAQRVLEIGTLGGYSTIWMARARPSGGSAAERRVTATALQTVRVKGYDGFAILLVVDPQLAA